MNRPELTFPSAHSWVCLAAAVPFTLIALASAEYGAALPYSIGAAIFLLQALVPTRPGWWLVFAASALAAGVVGYIVLADLIRLVAGKPPEALIDPDDTAMSLGVWLLLITLAMAVHRTRAIRREPSQSRSSS